MLSSSTALADIASPYLGVTPTQLGERDWLAHVWSDGTVLPVLGGFDADGLPRLLSG